MMTKNRAWLCSLVVFALGVWHFLDIQSAILECGDKWLAYWYGGLLLAVFAGLGLLYKLLKEDSKKSLESIYLAAGLFFGILYLLVLPPLSAPDEISHYISAYQLSSRLLGKPSNSVTGHVLVRAEDMWLEDINGSYQYGLSEDNYLQPVPESTEYANVLGGTLTEETYKAIRQQLWRKLYPDITSQELELLYSDIGIEPKNLQQVMVVSPYPPVNTTSIAHFPQALGIALCRVFHLNTVLLIFCGRLCNLLFFIMMTYFSMKRLPFGKEILFGVSLLPMTLHLAASFSYDVMILGCMFYLTAICLDLAYEKEKVRFKDVAVLAILMAAAGPCKMVYGVLMGLCLLIPVKKFGSWKNWVLAAMAVVLAWVLAMGMVNSQTIITYATETQSNVPWADEAGYSLSLLIHRPIQTIRMFYQTLLLQAEHYHLTMIGAYLGNLDEVLNVPYLIVILFTICLFLLTMKKPEESQRIPLNGRIWVVILCAGCGAAIMLSMLIAWTPLSSPIISGVQGRYFLPFLPILLISCKNNFIILTKNQNRSILYLMCCANGYVLLRLFSIVSMRL